MIQNLNYKTLIIRFLMILTWLIAIFIFLFASSYFNKTDKNSINVFAWSGLYDLHYITKFEKETGIKVRFSYYESNEELLVKLKATKGQGYDLIIPGDYTVDILKKENLLKKLDKSKLDFFKNLNPILLGHFYDPNNDYSIPAEWAVFGIGIDKNYFKNKVIDPSWSLVFDTNKIDKKIIMSNDPFVSIPLASFYLFGSYDQLTLEQLNKIKEVLIKQKPHVEAYVDFRPDYYIATGNSPVAVSSSAYIWRSMYSFDNIDFIIPKEGSMVTIENFAIPITSNKEEQVYKFLNFLMRPKTVKHHFEGEQSLFPVTIDVLDQLELTPTVKSLLTMTKKDFKKFSFFRLDNLKPPINEQYLQDLWIKIKS